MDEPPHLFSPAPEETPAAPAGAPAEPVRRKLLSYLAVLLATASLAFALTTWWLVHKENPGNLLDISAEPANVVRQQLAALNSGDLHAAYSQFSATYRQQVPFEYYQELITDHWEMFRARRVQFHADEELPNYVVLETHILASDGQRYLARYTLRRLQGRWWIDDMRWGPEPGRKNLIGT